MPGLLTEVTEVATALGTLRHDLDEAFRDRPDELENVPEEVWGRLVASHRAGEHTASFETAFANGLAFLEADQGLRGRRPFLVEWKGAHRPPGDDVIPADLRIDHVYLVSCKYLSKLLVNASPSRLFERLLTGEHRTGENWFAASAPGEYAAFYEAARGLVAAPLPRDHRALSAEAQRSLRRALAARALPDELRPSWSALCRRVAEVSAQRWCIAMGTPRAKLHLLWRLLRVSNATYFILGTSRAADIRLRVGSTWDWNHRFEVRSLDAEPRAAGQPEVAWSARVRARETGAVHEVRGHVEIRWSHGRFVGTPEAKVYLDVPFGDVPGYGSLVERPLVADRGDGGRPAEVAPQLSLFH